MELRKLAALAIACIPALGCGDDLPCSPYDWSGRGGGTPGCGAAEIFAARDATGLVPHEGDVLRYFDRWTRAVVAEPELVASPPQRYRDGLLIDIRTTNPTVISAWERGAIRTGDTAFDAVIAQLYPLDLNPNYDASLPDGSVYFIIHVAAMYNEDLLAKLLLPLRAKNSDSYQYPWADSTWTWIGAPPGTSGNDSLTAKIDARFGWGDCPNGCLGFHYLRAIVPPSGPATVYDMGGDPLPPNIHLSPNTKPPPS